MVCMADRQTVRPRALPPITRAFEDYKQSRQGVLPNVPFQMLTALELNSGDWAQIARNGSWQQVRQNLNTFLRHEVFAKSKNIKMVAEKLRDETAIARARVLPYQLLTAYQATSNQMPFEIREALQRCDGNRCTKRTGHPRQSRGLSGRFRLYAQLGYGLSRQRNQQNPLHRHRRARVRRHVAHQPASPRNTV